MLRTPEKGENLTGNDRFEGYCKDLADLIANKLGINCKFIKITYHHCFMFDCMWIIFKFSQCKCIITAWILFIISLNEDNQ